jgi:hypothetical protein
MSVSVQTAYNLCQFQLKHHITYVLFELCDIRAIKHKDKPSLTHILSSESGEATNDDMPYTWQNVEKELYMKITEIPYMHQAHS